LRLGEGGGGSSESGLGSDELVVGRLERGRGVGELVFDESEAFVGSFGGESKLSDLGFEVVEGP
jgi:hypothetical protein